MSKYLLTGKVVGVFGLKGELKVFSESDTNRFFKDNELYKVTLTKENINFDMEN